MCCFRDVCVSSLPNAAQVAAGAFLLPQCWSREGQTREGSEVAFSNQVCRLPALNGTGLGKCSSWTTTSQGLYMGRGWRLARGQGGLVVPDGGARQERGRARPYSAAQVQSWHSTMDTARALSLPPGSSCGNSAGCLMFISLGTAVAPGRVS